MRSPAFWWRPAGVLAAALAPASRLYGAVASRRLERPGVSAPCRVVCVGNVTVGGSGKTPTALAFAAMLVASGRKPGFLTRGYGGRLPGPALVAFGRHDASDVGDEALLLARAGPTVVSRDRPAGASLLARQGIDVIVMDDGLQNPALDKDLSVAVFDGGAGIGNGLPLPAGPLRAPLDAQWRLIDVVLVIGTGLPGDSVATEAVRRGLPVLRARLDPDDDTVLRLGGTRVLAFAGIGRPAKFFETLKTLGAEIVASRTFPDHHVFRAFELTRLADEARRGGLRLVTTEKDVARLGALAARHGIEAAAVTLVFDDPERASGLLLSRV